MEVDRSKTMNIFFIYNNYLTAEIAKKAQRSPRISKDIKDFLYIFHYRTLRLIATGLFDNNIENRFPEIFPVGAEWGFFIGFQVLHFGFLDIREGFWEVVIERRDKSGFMFCSFVL